MIDRKWLIFLEIHAGSVPGDRHCRGFEKQANQADSERRRIRWRIACNGMSSAPPEEPQAMKTLHSFAAAAIVVAMLPNAAAADPGTKCGAQWLNARDTRQQVRIDRGIANGSLTGREAARLQYRDNKLDNWTDRALSDGDLSRSEFVRLNRAYNHESRFIYEQKHDKQVP
jgi:hypothetical protein